MIWLTKIIFSLCGHKNLLEWSQLRMLAGTISAIDAEEMPRHLTLLDVKKALYAKPKHYMGW